VNSLSCHRIGAIVNSSAYGGGLLESLIAVLMPFAIGAVIAGVIAALLPGILGPHIVLLYGLCGLGFILVNVYLSTWAESM
jgi:hypothetical protein